MDLHGKVAVVTGGAHRVGKGIALALAREGAHVVVHYGRAADEADDTRREIESFGVEAYPVQADLAKPDEIDALFAAVKDYFGRLDVLVNSAANFIKEPFDQITLDSWKDALQVNLRAPFLCSQQAARLMKQSSRPSDESALIVNISDLMGIQPWRNFVQHGVAKAGLNQLTQVMAVELAPAIRVNAIVPGPILPPANLPPDAWQRIYEAVPLKRPGNPGYIAQTVVFLAANDFITGAIIPVDGGGHLVGPRQG
ncbi:MAG TPA: SDR family oxidoreductase [Aggregatilineaceae bacterium]|nr:SDR family oxidoreductase [Aggregatilineaceae bacterium]